MGHGVDVLYTKLFNLFRRLVPYSPDAFYYSVREIYTGSLRTRPHDTLCLSIPFDSNSRTEVANRVHHIFSGTMDEVTSYLVETPIYLS